MLHPDYTEHLKILADRWSRALDDAGFDAVAIRAGSAGNYFLDDQSPPFRPNPHFAQWYPDPDCAGSALLLRPGTRPALYFWQPEDYWHQPPEMPDWAGDHFDVAVFRTLPELESALVDALRRSNRMACVGAQPLAAPDSVSHNPQRLLAGVHYDRACKTGFEIACMTEASLAAARGHRAAAAAFAAGASEFETHLQYLQASAQTSEQLPYPSIVAQNRHAGVLHYQHYARTPAVPARSFLIDAGASHRGYAADVTRTYAAAGAPGGDAFAGLITDLNALQLGLVDEIRPGLNYLDLHETAHRRLAELLVHHRIIRGSPEAAFASGLTRTFLPHGLGHLIGLQTHDVGGLQADRSGKERPPPDAYPALRLTRDLEPGQVLTIEPGLYFIPQLLDAARAAPAGRQIDWDRIKTLLPFGGIRIEDNVLVTRSGADNLTRTAFAREFPDG